MTPDQAWAKYYERESKKGNGKRKEKQFHEEGTDTDTCVHDGVHHDAGDGLGRC